MAPNLDQEMVVELTQQQVDMITKWVDTLPIGGGNREQAKALIAILEDLSARLKVATQLNLAKK